MVDIIKSETSLDAQPVAVGRALAAIDVKNFVVLDMHACLAADAAIGAKGVHRAVFECGPHPLAVEKIGFHEGAGRTNLHAFAAGHTGRLAHRRIEIEHDLRLMTAVGQADDFVGLHLAAGADAQIALDAGVQIDGDGRVRGI